MHARIARRHVLIQLSNIKISEKAPRIPAPVSVLPTRTSSAPEKPLPNGQVLFVSQKTK